jgi:hypothetical protein
MRSEDWWRMANKARVAQEKLKEIAAIADRPDLPPAIREDALKALDAVNAVRKVVSAEAIIARRQSAVSRAARAHHVG